MKRWALRPSARLVSAFVAALGATPAWAVLARQTESPDGPIALYNAACKHSLRAETAQAEELLLEALKAGFSDLSWMQRDPDLIPIRDSYVFRTILRARDAADPILASRQREEWLDALGSDEYRVRVDDERRLSYVTAIDDALLARVIVDTAWRSEYLIDTLFDEPLRHFVLVALPRGEDRSRLMPDSHVHGSYHHARRQLLAADEGRALRHELVHVLHHCHMDRLGQDHPMWIQEGLACLFESLVLDDEGSVSIRPTERESIARTLSSSDGMLDWETLFTLRDRELLADPGPNYAQARSIFLFLTDRGLLDEWYDTYTGRFDFDPTGAFAMEVVFERPLATIEEEWRAWVDDGRGRHVVVDRTTEIRAFPDAPAGLAEMGLLDGVGALEEEPDILLLLADGKTLYDAGEYEEAISVLQEVIDVMPDHPAARYALGLAYLRTADFEAAREQNRILDQLDRSLGSLLSNLTSK